jgi:hypothetical protein
MKTKKFSGKCRSYYGVKFAKLKMKDGSAVPFKVLPFKGEYAEYETREEVTQAEGWPKDEDIIKWRNTLVKNAAKAKEQNSTVDAAGVQKPDLENNDQLQLKVIFKALMASGKKTREEARAIASQNIGVAWDDDDEEAEEEDAE